MEPTELTVQLELVFPGEGPRLEEDARKDLVQLVAQLIRSVASQQDARRHDGEDPSRPSES